MAFSRPGALRLELPGPTGRALHRGGPRAEDMVAVFPGERAVWQGAATATEMEALLGVRLSPAELMDLLTGTPAGRLSDYRASWGDQLPRRLDATLEDGDPDRGGGGIGGPRPRASRGRVRAAPERRLPGGGGHRGPAPAGDPLMAALRLPSFAKVNLGLEVLRGREDGYHELRTLFQTVNLADELELHPRRLSGIEIECDHPLVPKDETNLAGRAALEMLRFAGRKTGLRIVLRKRIPVGGGLGGGSSNAAAVLLALDRLWQPGPGHHRPSAPGPAPGSRRALLPLRGHGAGGGAGGRGLPAAGAS